MIFSGKPGISGLKEQNFALGKVKRCESQFWDPAGDVAGMAETGTWVEQGLPLGRIKAPDERPPLSL